MTDLVSESSLSGTLNLAPGLQPSSVQSGGIEGVGLRDRGGVADLGEVFCPRCLPPSIPPGPITRSQLLSCLKFESLSDPKVSLRLKETWYRGVQLRHLHRTACLKLLTLWKSCAELVSIEHHGRATTAAKDGRQGFGRTEAIPERPAGLAAYQLPPVLAVHRQPSEVEQLDVR